MPHEKAIAADQRAAAERLVLAIVPRLLLWRELQLDRWISLGRGGLRTPACTGPIAVCNPAAPLADIDN